MNVSCSFIQNQLNAGFQFVYTSLSRWIGYSVGWICKASPYVQNPYVASATLIGINVALFEIAVLVTKLFNQSLNLFVRYDDASAKSQNIRQALLGTLFFTIYVGGQWALHGMLRLPLSPVKVIVISLPTFLVYLMVRS